MRVRFAFIDPSAETFVVGCVACPWWSALALNRLDAYAAQARHDALVHGVEPAYARGLERRYQARHAATPD